MTEQTYDVRFHFPYATVSTEGTPGLIDAWQADLQNLVTFKVPGAYGNTFYIINPNLVTYIEVNEKAVF